MRDFNQVLLMGCLLIMLMVVLRFAAGCDTVPPADTGSINICAPPGSEEWPGTWAKPRGLRTEAQCEELGWGWKPRQLHSWRGWTPPNECGRCDYIPKGEN